MIEIIIAEIHWWVFACFCAFMEAHYYDCVYFNGNRNHKNLHPYFDVFRTAILLCISFSLGDIFNLWQIGLFAFFSGLTFSFWHNGIYGVVRNNLDKNVYKKRFFSVKEGKQTDGKESKFEWSAVFRTLAFIVGIIGIIYLSK